MPSIALPPAIPPKIAPAGPATKNPPIPPPTTPF